MIVDITAKGFFVHVIEGVTTRTAATSACTCAIDVPGWRHVYKGFVPKASVNLGSAKGLNQLKESGLEDWYLIDFDDLAKQEKDHLVITLELGSRLRRAASQTKRLTLKRGHFLVGLPEPSDAAASWHILDLMADFSDVFDGAMLDKKWRRYTDLGIVHSLDYPDGTISTDPETNLGSRGIWEWSGRTGASRRQPVTSNLHYTSDEVNRATLVIRPSAAKVALLTLPLVADREGMVFVQLTSQPDPTARGNPRAKYLLDLAHAHAALRFGKIIEGRDVRWAQARRQGRVGSANARVAGCGQPNDPFFRLGYRNPGQVGCSAISCIDPPQNPPRSRPAARGQHS